MAPPVEQTWEQFSHTWTSDVKLSLLCSQHPDSSWQEGLQIVHERDGTSRLFGAVQDQPALYGLLIKIHHLSLTLLALECSDLKCKEG